MITSQRIAVPCYSPHTRDRLPASGKRATQAGKHRDHSTALAPPPAIHERDRLATRKGGGATPDWRCRSRSSERGGGSPLALPRPVAASLSSEPGLAPGAESAPASPAPGGRLGATIARNAMFSVGGRLTFLFAWALITPFMLHVLGENRFAIWALFFALSGYFATFDLGLTQALVKYVAQFSTAGDARALRGVVTLGALAFVTLAAPVVVVLATFQGPILDAIHTPAPW